ncbi:WYL domain-containing protein [Sphingomonas sp. I4]
MTDRVIWPFAMALFDRAEVLLGWCELRRDYRTFRIDRIVAARVLLDRYPRPRAVLLGEMASGGRGAA